MGKTNKTGTVSGNAGAGGRGPIGDGAGRAGGGSVTRGTDFTADPIGQTRREGGRDFTGPDAGSHATAGGVRDRTLDAPEPPISEEDTRCTEDAPTDRQRYVVDSFARQGEGARGTGSIGDGHRPFKLR